MPDPAMMPAGGYSEKRRKKAPKMEVSSLSIRKSDNEGFVVECHYRGKGGRGEYDTYESTSYVFEDLPKMLAHVKKELS